MWAVWQRESEKERQIVTCNAAYGNGHCCRGRGRGGSHFKAKKYHLFTTYKIHISYVFPFGSTRAFSLSMQRHCIFRVKHMRTSYFLQHFPCVSPRFSQPQPTRLSPRVLSLCCPFLARLGASQSTDGLMIAKTCLTLRFACSCSWSKGGGGGGGAALKLAQSFKLLASFAIEHISCRVPCELNWTELNLYSIYEISKPRQLKVLPISQASKQKQQQRQKQQQQQEKKLRQ